MSAFGMPAERPYASLKGWAALARLVVGTVYADAMGTESIKPAVDYPLRSARIESSGSAITGSTPSNDAEDAKLPGDGDRPGEPIDDQHLQMWTLVQAAQTGDGEAFGKLYDHYASQVFRFIYYRVNDRALAEDFTSETFLRALRRISGINYQGRDIGAWFMTIARNIVFDHAKSARFRLEMTTGEILENGETEAGPELTVLTNLTNTRLLQAVKELGEEQQECIVLRFLNGLSVAETAAAMGKNDGAIKALQHRAVKRLAAILGDELR
jgi:RNA polymerase sigma-70 factor (ECF subfamily)